MAARNRPHGTRAITRAASSLPESRLILVGDGPTRPAMETLAGRLGISGRIEFTGAVPNDRLDYRRFDFAVLSTRYEGHPLTLLEAMARGLAIVATDVPGVNEVVRHGVEGLLVPPQDPRALAAAMAVLANDPAGRERMGRAGRLRVERDFDLDQWPERLIRLYNSL